MFTWANFALQLAKLLNLVAALFKSKRDREAGRNEAILEQKVANDAATDKGLAARRDARARDASADRLREDDGYRRD